MLFSQQLQDALVEDLSLAKKLAAAFGGHVPYVISKDVPHLGRMAESLTDAILAETQGDTGALSKVKKQPAPHMWFIAKTGRDAWVVSIGDPTKTSSKVKRTFHNKDDLKYWVKYEMADQVSPNHVIDRSGLKLVPDYYTQWYVDNMKGK